MSYEFDDKPSEKCAVAGIIDDYDAVTPTMEALRSLQHRGQEASGIASMKEDGSLIHHREPGLVRDVYRSENAARLAGRIAVGHNRYTTNGEAESHLQPVVDESIGFAFAHNGNLPDITLLENKLQKHNVITRRLNDSEMMARTLATYIRSGKELPEAVEKAYERFNGAFSCVAMHDGQIVAFRDGYGVRPLSYARLGKNCWAVTSETCAQDAIEANFIREVRPGEMLIFEDGRPPESRQLVEGKEKLDIFEFVYFARPDSLLYGQRVNEVRRRFGQELAEEHCRIIPDDLSNILVVPVPDTSIAAAEGFADCLGLQHRQAIIKDRYINRTFILPNQHNREKQLKIKHNIIPEAVQGRDVILIDDSIVRLNTMPKIVERIKQHGAKSVKVLIASPPVRFPDFYGMDTPEQADLAAAVYTVEEMQRRINADYLGFLSLSRMIRATKCPAEKFNLSCFNGEYPIPIGNWRNTITKPVSMDYIDI